MEEYYQIEETITTEILDNYNNGRDFSDKKEKEKIKFKCISKLVKYLFKYKSDKTIFKIVNNSINLVLSLFENYPVDLFSGEMAYSENWLNKFEYYIYHEYRALSDGRVDESEACTNDSRANQWRREQMIKTIWRFHEEQDATYFIILGEKKTS